MLIQKVTYVYENETESEPLSRFVHPYLAMSYNNAGVFYYNQGQPQKAEEYYLKAIEIYEALANKNPERFNPDLADSYNNAGVFYKNQGQPQKAEEYYRKAKELIGNA